MKKLINNKFKNINIKSKSSIIKALAISGGIVGTLFTTATYAYLNTKTTSVVNNFSGAAVNIGIVEQGNDGVYVYEDMDIQGNGKYNDNANNINTAYNKIDENNKTQQKSVSIKNITSDDYKTTDTYVRVRLVPAVVYDNSEENIKNNIAGQTVDIDLKGKVSYTFNTQEYDNGMWVCKQNTNDVNDNYYYFTGIVKPGETTPELIKDVTCIADIPSNAHFELKVLAQGINANPYYALEQWGVGVDSNKRLIVNL